jgi:hypothetical protein
MYPKGVAMVKKGKNDFVGNPRPQNMVLYKQPVRRHFHVSKLPLYNHMKEQITRQI